MNYYDNVKDAVKDNGEGGNRNDASFDTLKEEAEKTDVEEDEERGDGTPIEVLEDGGLKEQSSESSTKTRSKSSDNKSESGANPLTGNSENSEASSQDTSALEQKLDRIIEQNEEMIEILRSFGT